MAEVAQRHGLRVALLWSWRRQWARSGKGASKATKFAAVRVRMPSVEGVIDIDFGSRTHQEEFIRAFETMRLRPVIDRTFPLENIPDAFRFQETGRHIGKICLEW
jgi:transposase-like protein